MKLSGISLIQVVAILMAGLSIWGSAQAGTPEQAGNRSTVVGEQSYTLGPEDVVTVSVLKHPEFSGDFLISQSGYLQLPAVGQLRVEGLSLYRLQQIVRTKLAERLWKPEVTISLKIARLQRVYVIGVVRGSGAFDWKPNWNVAQALGVAGGIDSSIQPADVNVSIDRANGTHSSFSLLYTLTHSEDSALKLNPGDTVRFDTVALFSVYVVGQVQKPGAYQVRSDSATVVAAIAEAGGVTPQASLHVKVVHTNGKVETDDLTPDLVHGQPTPSPQLAPGDVIEVSESLDKFDVLGYVAHPGSFSIPEGQVYHLSDALAVANGATEASTNNVRHGRITRIGLVRLVNGKPYRAVYNLDLYISKGDLSQNPVIVQGDLIYVPQSNEVGTAVIIGALAAASTIYYDSRH